MPFEEEPELPKPFVDVSAGDPDDSPESVNRVTVRLSMIRERWSEDSQSFPSAIGWEESIYHDSPAYIVPDFKIGADALKLNLGWVEEPILICVLNKTCWKGTANPSAEQISQIKKSLVWIGFDGETWPLCISPDASQPLFVSGASSVYVKAVEGNPTIAIFAT